MDQAASGTKEGASAPPTPKEPAKECPARQEETPGEAPEGVAAAATDESGQKQNSLYCKAAGDTSQLDFLAFI